MDLSRPVPNMTRLARALRNPRTYKVAGREAIGYLSAGAAYPLGLWEGSSSNGHSPHPTDPVTTAPSTALDTPILLLHGLGHNHSGYWLLRSRLQRAGFSRIHYLNYSPLENDIISIAKTLRDHIAQLQDEQGIESVNLVGHSMGGLIARYYVESLDGHHNVAHVVTLGTPHQGTRAATALAEIGLPGHQLAWQSPLIMELNAVPLPEGVRYTSVWSATDQMVIPAESGLLNHKGKLIENIHVPDHGHMSLLVSRSVADIVIARLSVNSLATESSARDTTPRKKKYRKAG